MYHRDEEGNITSKGVLMHIAERYHEKYEGAVSEEIDVSNSSSSSSKVKVAVGSKNPVKIAAAKEGLEKAMACAGARVVECEAFNSPSGVPDQPVGDDETRTRATNRAVHAYNAFKEANEGLAPDYSIGLEGGIDRTQFGMDCFAYMVNQILLHLTK